MESYRMTGSMDVGGEKVPLWERVEDKDAWDAAAFAAPAPAAPYEPIRMRRFVMERKHDVNKTSGEGVVVEGVQFTDGKVVLKWRTSVSSIVIWDNIESAALIHGHGGDTVIRWLDPPWPELG